MTNAQRQPVPAVRRHDRSVGEERLFRRGGRRVRRQEVSNARAHVLGPRQSAGASQRRATPATGWAAPVRAQAATAVPAAATHHRRMGETAILGRQRFTLSARRYPDRAEGRNHN